MLIGNGAMAVRRLQWLVEAGATQLAVHADAPSDDLVTAAGARLTLGLPSPQDLAAAHLVFVADPERADLAALAGAARAAGAIVHVEDAPLLTDVHAPAILRRGDLTIAVSTNGASPALARQVKRFLSGIFGPEWQERLVLLAQLRTRWRAGGAPSRTIAGWTEEWVSRSGWLKESMAPIGSPAYEDGDNSGQAAKVAPH